MLLDCTRLSFVSVVLHWLSTIERDGTRLHGSKTVYRLCAVRLEVHSQRLGLGANLKLSEGLNLHRIHEHYIKFVGFRLLTWSYSFLVHAGF